MYNKLTPEDWERIRQGNTGFKTEDLNLLEWLDLAATYGGTAAAEIGGGLRGLLGLAYGESLDEAVKGIDTVRGLAYEPRTRDAQMVMGILGDTFAPVEEVMQSAREGAGDTAFDLRGSPAAGTAGYMAPDAAIMGASAVIPPAMGVFPLIRRAARNAPNIPKEKPSQVPVGLRPRDVYAQTDEAGFSSKLENSLLDIQQNPNIGDTVPSQWLQQELRSRGVTDEELRFSNMPPNLFDPEQEVSVSGLLGVVKPPRLGQWLEEGGNVTSNTDKSFTPQYYRDLAVNSMEMLDVEQAKALGADFAAVDNNYFLSHAQHNKDLVQFVADMQNEDYRKGRLGPDEAADAELDARNLIWEIRGREKDPEKFKQRMEEAGFKGFAQAYDDSLSRREQRQYDEKPLFRSAFTAEDYDGQAWDIDIFGNNEDGYSIKVDGEPISEGGVMASRDLARTMDEAYVRVQSYLESQGFHFRPDPSNEAPEIRWQGNVQGYPEGWQENVVLTLDTDLNDYENYTHFPGVYGNVGHIRASQRQYVPEGSTPFDPPQSVYFVDEIQSDLHSDARKAGGFNYEGIDADIAQAREVNTQAAKAIAKLRSEGLDYDALRSDFEAIGDAGWLDAELGSVTRDSNRSLFESRSYYTAVSAVSEPARFMTKIKSPRNEAVIDGLYEKFHESLAKKGEKAEERIMNNNYAYNSAFKEFMNTDKDAAKIYDDLVKTSTPEIYKAKQANDNLQLTVQEVDRLNTRSEAPDPAPLANNEWVNATVKKSIMRAIERGENRVAFANSENAINNWPNEDYRKGFEFVYDQKLPSALKKFAKKYGAKVEQIELYDDALKQQGKNWSIEITPEMKEAIQKYGIDLYGKVKDGLLNSTEEQQSNFGGLLA